MKVVLGLKEGVEIPSKATELASGIDVVANSIEAIYHGTVSKDSYSEESNKSFAENGHILRPFERVLFGTGIMVESIPDNKDIKVYSKSGQTLKKGLTVLNAPGIVDSDYRGEIKVIICNNSEQSIHVKQNERIAQIKVEEKCDCEVNFTTFDTTFEIENTERGENGFGSSGII